MKYVSLYAPPSTHVFVRRVAAGLVACVLGVPMASQAATATATFDVSATVTATCTISAAALTFGDYAPTTATDTDASSDITVQCTNGASYNVGLDAGTFTSATVTTRKMSGADAAGLSYALYSDSGHTTNWGNTVGTDTESSTGTGTAQTLTVYGRIPAGQWVTSGNYSDTITATINY